MVAIIASWVSRERSILPSNLIVFCPRCFAKRWFISSTLPARESKARCKGSATLYTALVNSSGNPAWNVVNYCSNCSIQRVFCEAPTMMWYVLDRRCHSLDLLSLFITRLNHSLASSCPGMEI